MVIKPLKQISLTVSYDCRPDVETLNQDNLKTLHEQYGKPNKEEGENAPNVDDQSNGESAEKTMDTVGKTDKEIVVDSHGETAGG